MATILVVDDSLVDQRVAGEFVIALDAIPIYASNGREALEIIERQRPDVVLTDLQMPEIDGLQLVRTVRKNYPAVPIILMTAYGSEDVAVQALRAGASSYVPKKELKTQLREALHAVLEGVEAAKYGLQVRQFLELSESRFILGYDPEGQRALIGYLQEGLTQLNFCDEAELNQISTALSEALSNAVNHGNLELDSDLRDSLDNDYYQLAAERSKQSPYNERRVYVTSKLTPSEAIYIIKDEGPGFDPSKLPDPTAVENLLKPTGRGVMLIRTFMDEVSFSPSGNEITMVKRRAV